MYVTYLANFVKYVNVMSCFIAGVPEMVPNVTVTKGNDLFITLNCGVCIMYRISRISCISYIWQVEVKTD